MVMVSKCYFCSIAPNDEYAAVDDEVEMLVLRISRVVDILGGFLQFFVRCL